MGSGKQQPAARRPLYGQRPTRPNAPTRPQPTPDSLCRLLKKNGAELIGPWDKARRRGLFYHQDSRTDLILDQLTDGSPLIEMGGGEDTLERVIFYRRHALRPLLRGMERQGAGDVMVQFEFAPRLKREHNDPVMIISERLEQLAPQARWQLGDLDPSAPRSEVELINFLLGDQLQPMPNSLAILRANREGRLAFDRFGETYRLSLRLTLSEILAACR